MKLWYQVLIKHNREAEDGMLKQVTEQYLFDAVSYTDAEKRGYEWGEQNCSGGFSVPKIQKLNIAEVVTNGSSGLFWQAKVQYQTVDGDSDKLVKINHVLILEAVDIKHAIAIVESHLSSMLVPYVILDVKQTKIVEVLELEMVEG